MKIELGQAEVEEAIKEYVARRHPSLKVTNDDFEWWDGDEGISDVMSVGIEVENFKPVAQGGKAAGK